MFESSDDGDHWYKLSEGMPNAPILDLSFSGDHSTLFVANYGRGVYALPLTTSVTGGGAGGSVPATLALSLGTPGSFGAFTPGVAKDYDTSVTADVVSTAGDAALSVSDSGPAAGTWSTALSPSSSRSRRRPARPPRARAEPSARSPRAP